MYFVKSYLKVGKDVILGYLQKRKIFITVKGFLSVIKKHNGTDDLAIENFCHSNPLLRLQTRTKLFDLCQ